jgi:serine/threonine-protein kinase
MAGRVSIEVNKGRNAGKRYSYTEKESLVLGRKKSCAIAFPEKTVSRYHCLIDIAPPKIMVRDFGSKNGTWLNGVMIGQRPAGMTPEEAQRTRFNEHVISDGDILMLGPDCELKFSVEVPPVCEMCGRELENGEVCSGKEKKRICEECLQKEKEAEHRKKEAKKQAEEALRRHAREQQKLEEAQLRRARSIRRCSVCGAVIEDDPTAPNICKECRRDPIKLLECLMNRANAGEEDAAELKGYEQIEKLGEGGMAQVWLVEERASGKRLALKLMLPQAANDQRRRDFFLREASLLGQLSHRHIVKQIANGGLGETFFILMEYCEGGSLDKYLRRMGNRLSIDESTDVVLQVLDGLSYAHTAAITLRSPDGEEINVSGVVHRDFKPGNIFIHRSGRKTSYKVADFGLAKAFQCAGFTSHTMTGDYCGTFRYMPRSQILNYRYAKPVVDLWAAMATYYGMLTGYPVRDFRRGEDYAYTVLQRDPVPIRERDPNIPKKLAALIDSILIPFDECDSDCMSASELGDAIREALR